MSDITKRVDESWKEQVEREKQAASTGGPAAESSPQAPPTEPAPGRPKPEEAEGIPDARFDLFLSGLTMEAFVALGDLPHPTTRKQAANLPQAKYLIDLLGLIEQKTTGNLTVDEERLLKDALYQLRMRYLAKAGSG